MTVQKVQYLIFTLTCVCLLSVNKCKPGPGVVYTHTCVSINAGLSETLPQLFQECQMIVAVQLNYVNVGFHRDIFSSSSLQLNIRPIIQMNEWTNTI